MAPSLSGGIDHVHVYVRNREAAAGWYAAILGLEVVAGLEIWSEDPAGPLTVQNPEGTIHLALFDTDKPPHDVIALGASGEEFLAWKNHLEGESIALRVADHQLAFSLYFADPDGNLLEITTYDADRVRAELGDA